MYNYHIAAYITQLPLSLLWFSSFESFSYSRITFSYSQITSRQAICLQYLSPSHILHISEPFSTFLDEFTSFLSTAATTPYVSSSPATSTYTQIAHWPPYLPVSICSVFLKPYSTCKLPNPQQESYPRPCNHLDFSEKLARKWTVLYSIALFFVNKTFFKILY